MKASARTQDFQAARPFWTRNTLFVSILGLWFLFLTGLFGRNGYAPGLIQALGLRNLLIQKKTAIAMAEQQTAELSAEKHRLQTDAAYLEREVRRVLNVVGPHEILIETDAPLR